VNELIGEANCETHRLELASRYQKVILRKFATVGSFIKAADAISSVPSLLYVGRGSPFDVFVVKSDGKVYELMIRENEEKYELMDKFEFDVQRDLLFDVFVVKDGEGYS
ncbi:19672_t:CDS:2, partial [Rhizophagus irregularis]